jgi:hypothetical protein
LPAFRRFEEFERRGEMRTRILVGGILFVAIIAAATLVARAGTNIGSDTQWTLVNFVEPVLVKGQFVMGKVLIVHDNAKMARGEACTTFYRFDPAAGPKEELVSFHCNPKKTGARATTIFTTVSSEPGCKRLVEYQIAGDTEAHGIPIK